MVLLVRVDCFLSGGLGARLDFGDGDRDFLRVEDLPVDDLDRLCGIAGAGLWEIRLSGGAGARFCFGEGARVFRRDRRFEVVGS